MADYTLPDLPYDYAALEPHISGRIMQLHHDKHHAAYVKGANDTLEQLAEARDKESWGAINGLEKNLAFHLSGHILHSIYWHNMTGDGGGELRGVIGIVHDEGVEVAIAGVEDVGDLDTVAGADLGDVGGVNNQLATVGDNRLKLVHAFAPGP